jgi:putative ABC transport system permease protein
MFKNYVKIAFRNLFRNKVYTTINISCLAFGMACTILLLLWVQDECNYDGFHKNANTIFLIHKSVFTPKREFWTRTTPAPLAYDLHQKYPEIINTARVARAGELVVKYQDKMFVEKQVAGVDPGYFEMFTVPFLKGDSLTALSQPYSIIITEALALKYFGETNPMGQILRINNQFDCLVRGIIQNSPTNTNNRFDAFVPFTFLKALGFDPENYHADNCLTYVQIQPNLNYQSLSQKIFNQFSTPVPAKEAVEKFYLIPLTEVRFYRNVHKIVVYVFSILAGVILLIACINYINLSTAQAMNRTREVGIRKVVGATQSQLGWQFLGESLWITLLALILALVLVEIFLPLFNYHSGKQLAIDYANYRMLLSFPGIGLLTGIVAGSYPAFFLAAFKPTSVFKV